MKAPPKGWHPSHEGSGQTSYLGTLFHSMLVASQEANIPLFNEYFLPHGYTKLNGMPSAPLSRWGVASSLSDKMYAHKVNETIHDIFGERTPNKKARGIEKLGLEYMKALHAMEENHTIHHKHNLVQSKRAVKVLNERKGRDDIMNIVEAQTILFSWFTQFNQCSHLGNHMVESLLYCEDTSYLYTFNTPSSRYLAEGITNTKGNDDWLSNSGAEKTMEINPWRVVPMDDNGDMVSQYFSQEMVQQPYDSYTPYWTTIDYTWNHDQHQLTKDLLSAISDPNIFPITVSKTHFLFCHRLLGFFCLRALPVRDSSDVPSPWKYGLNFRRELVNMGNEFSSQHGMAFSKYFDVEKTGLTIFKGEREYQGGKTIYTINEYQYANLAPILADELSTERNILPCRNLAKSSALGSASARSYARRLKMFYGLCVGMASVDKAKPYTLKDGGAVVADSLIFSFNKQFERDEEEEIEMLDGTYKEKDMEKKVRFHGSLRSIYTADTDPWTWGEIVNEYSTSSEIPKPTHASEFIPSWKDMRSPITINVSGAPPIGFYHKERRCKVCNGRVILTTPAHCKVETVQCPHCRNGKIEVNE